MINMTSAELKKYYSDLEEKIFKDLSGWIPSLEALLFLLAQRSIITRIGNDTQHLPILSILRKDIDVLCSIPNVDQLRVHALLGEGDHNKCFVKSNSHGPLIKWLTDQNAKGVLQLWETAASGHEAVLMQYRPRLYHKAVWRKAGESADENISDFIPHRQRLRDMAGRVTEEESPEIVPPEEVTDKVGVYEQKFPMPLLALTWDLKNLVHLVHLLAASSYFVALLENVCNADKRENLPPLFHELQMVISSVRTVASSNVVHLSNSPLVKQALMSARQQKGGKQSLFGLLQQLFVDFDILLKSEGKFSFKDSLQFKLLPDIGEGGDLVTGFDSVVLNGENENVQRALASYCHPETKNSKFFSTVCAITFAEEGAIPTTIVRVTPTPPAQASQYFRILSSSVAKRFTVTEMKQLILHHLKEIRMVLVIRQNYDDDEPDSIPGPRPVPFDFTFQRPTANNSIFVLIGLTVLFLVLSFLFKFY